MTAFARLRRSSRTLLGVALCVAAACAGVSTPTLAQDSAAGRSDLRGVVRDSAGAPLAGVQVAIPALDRRTLTGTDGRFVLVGLPAGTVRVTASRIGLQTARRDVVVPATGPIEFVLAPAPTALSGMVITEQHPPGTVRPAGDRLGPLLVAGARSEVVTLEGSDANLAEKVGRQVFARVPGIQVYDMDGAGNQTNVSTRGLDPHRSWEFNVRQDGVSINSDVYGYPASHYSPPLEAMERVELVRGTAALQYGSQFGGLLNYVSRAPDRTRPLAARAVLTGGSFGLRNGYGEVSGTRGALEYQAYAAWRESDGFRDAARSRYSAQYARVGWRATPTLTLGAQVGRSWYLHRIPGPLTDAMFEGDATQATRERNWFSPTITVPALRAEWRPTGATTLTLLASGVTGDRSSVQFIGFATVPDTVSTASGLYAPRAVDIDDFDSRTYELRLWHQHEVAGRSAVLTTGVVVTDNDMRRRQQGPGTRGRDYDLTTTAPFGRDLRYRSRGVAAYAEELIGLTETWTIIPGVRIERGSTRMTGRLAYYDPADVPRRVRHDFPLFGLRTEYRLESGAEWYGGWSEAYRPMLLKDLLPENALERSDPSMRDARGWTVEGGLRANRLSRVFYDVGLFWMRYDGRFGALLRDDGAGQYLFKTNVGSTRTAGVELVVDAPLATTTRGSWRAFVTGTYFDAIYREGVAASSGTNVLLRGNRVEGVPRVIARTGITFTHATGTATLQVSHTGESFGDPFNTREPNATGARGVVPAYTLLDLTASRRLARGLTMRAGVTNLLDARYFTKRPAFYPGPGVWPSDGRGLTLGLELAR